MIYVIYICSNISQKTNDLQIVQNGPERFRTIASN